MLAPTRELVAELNRRARDHRLDTRPDPAEVRLADGNQASVGDVIITRTNDRRLRLTATDWVKNGDRWTITEIGRNGDLKVRHNRSRLTVRYPPTTSANRPDSATPPPSTPPKASPPTPCTDSLSGQESRQQLYTMLTRGRVANHLYLQVVGDGDPHTIIRPDTISPRTPTETLHQILARDEAPTSATTLLRELSDPAARLFDAVQRYTDGLHVAAEQLIGPQTVQMLDSRADKIVPELTSEPYWPTLRAHLLALAAETGGAPTNPPAGSSRRPRTPHRSRHGRRTRLAPPRARTYRPRTAAVASRHSGRPPRSSRLGRVPGEAVATCYRPRRSGSRPRRPEQRTAGLGTAGQPPERRPPW